MQPFFEWMENLKFATSLDDAGYLVAGINVMHLLALTIFIGAVLVVDMRLLGRGMSKQPVARVARDAQPWLVGGLIAVAITGVLQILATPMKAYYSANFWLKMELLIVAVILTFTVRHWIARADEGRVAPIWGKLVAIASIGLWTTIAVQGRFIGLLQ
jgi:hypothetical protein